MRRLAFSRLALILGATTFVPTLACEQMSSRPQWVSNASNMPTTAPSVIGSAPAAQSPTAASVTPKVTESVVPVLPPVPVTPGPMLARPISGGTLLVLADGHTVVASDADRDLVYAVDLISGTVSSTVALQTGDEP